MSERQQLPTREQIEALTDVEALKRLRDDVFAAKVSIETQLEVWEGDDDWARRAAGALTAHKITLANIDKQMHRLTRKPAPVIPDPNVKIKKAQAVAAMLEAEATAKDARLALQREKTRTQIAKALEATKLSAALQQAMRETLDNDTYSRVMLRAWELHEARVVKIVENA